MKNAKVLDIEAILTDWEEDSQIKRGDLEATTLETAKLHSKYLNLLTLAKVKRDALDMEHKVLLRQKWEWYNGKMSKTEMDRLGWDYDPLKGLRVLKGDMNYYYDSDPEIQKSLTKIKYNKTVLETLEEIINTIRWRHNQVKNILEYRKFESGV